MYYNAHAQNKYQKKYLVQDSKKVTYIVLEMTILKAIVRGCRWKNLRITVMISTFVFVGIVVIEQNIVIRVLYYIARYGIKMYSNL